MLKLTKQKDMPKRFGNIFKETSSIYCLNEKYTFLSGGRIMQNLFKKKFLFNLLVTIGFKKCCMNTNGRSK